MSWRAGFAALCAGLAGAAAAADALVTSTRIEPRAFGYQVGDVMTREIRIVVPDGLKVDAATLPQVGRRGRAFELRDVTWQGRREGGATQFRLRLEYQVFVSPPQVRTLELPPVVLRFDGPTRPQDLRIDAWPVTVAPLVPVEVSPRRGLGEMQPDTPAPLIDTGAVRTRLIAYLVLLALLFAYLAHVYLGAPWIAKRQRPFERAWRALRSLPAGDAAAPRRAAFKTVHEALNRSAGQVLFEHGIDNYVAAQPRYAELRAELQMFFQHSRQEFFADQGAANADVQAWLRDFCRRCRDAERGAA